MNNISPQYVDGLELHIEELALQLAAAQAKAEADRVDAERYRWLRDKRSVGIDTMLHGNGCKTHTSLEIDAAIDAALKP